MIIDIIDERNQLTSEQSQLIEELIHLAAQKLNLGDQIELDVSIVSNEEIHQLNKEFRNIDRPTDVLSFALEEVVSEFDLDYAEDDKQGQEQEQDDSDEFIEFERHLGDIIISYPKIVEQADEYGHSFERELGFLAVHGFLHLNGYDHQTPEESDEMFGLQEEVLAEYGLTR